MMIMMTMIMAVVLFGLFVDHRDYDDHYDDDYDDDVVQAGTASSCQNIYH